MLKGRNRRADSYFISFKKILPQIWPEIRMGLGPSRMPRVGTRMPLPESRTGLGRSRMTWPLTRIRLVQSRMPEHESRMPRPQSRMHQEGRNRQPPISTSFKKPKP